MRTVEIVIPLRVKIAVTLLSLSSTHANVPNHSPNSTLIDEPLIVGLVSATHYINKVVCILIFKLWIVIRHVAL